MCCIRVPTICCGCFQIQLHIDPTSPRCRSCCSPSNPNTEYTSTCLYTQCPISLVILPPEGIVHTANNQKNPPARRDIKVYINSPDTREMLWAGPNVQFLNCFKHKIQEKYKYKFEHKIQIQTQNTNTREILWAGPNVHFSNCFKYKIQNIWKYWYTETALMNYTHVKHSSPHWGCVVDGRQQVWILKLFPSVLPAVLATTSACQFIQDHVSGKLGWEAFAGASK